MKIERHLHVGAELCQVFGVDPNLVTRIEMCFAVGNIATVMITRHVTKAEGAALGATVRQYNVVPVPDGASQPVTVGTVTQTARTARLGADEAVRRALGGIP